MANTGKFIDRNPLICPGGIPGVVGEPIKSLLTHYTLEDHLEQVLQEKAKFRKDCEILTAGQSQKSTERGGAAECISPPEKTKFQEFYDKVYEAKYDSSKSRPLGQCRRTFSKPDHIDNECLAFGEATARGEPLYCLVLPKKTPFQVMAEHDDGHDKYLISHKHYFVAERVSRKYNSPPFDPKLTYGVQSKTEPGGKLVRRALEDIWFPDYMSISNTAQRNFLERYRSALGKPLQPNKIASMLPTNYTFGIPTKADRYSGEELIYCRQPYDNKTKLYECLRYLNRLRNCLKKRKSYDLDDMRLELEGMDTQFTGKLKLDACLCVMRTHNLEVDRESLEHLLQHFNMLDEEQKVNFKDFMNLLDCRHSVPDIGRLDDIFFPDGPTLTTYRNFTHDMFQDDPACKMEPAGMPSISLERELPKTQVGTVRADVDSLTEETDVRALLMQNIPNIYGLSHRDYFMPRPKDEIRSIFSSIGYELQDDKKFENLWDEALQHWTCKNNMASVEAFRYVLKTKNEERK